MTEKLFFDRLLEVYTEETDQDIPAQGLGYYLEYFLDNYPPEKLELKLTRKIAARIIHEFMRGVLGWEDLDWGDAAQIKDIYDCRVCSNAIAQVCVRKIMGAKEGRFGLNEILSDEEAEQVIRNLMGLIRQ